MTDTIRIPYKPRNWAKKLHVSYKRWAVLVLHRRAGKTTAILNHHQRAALDDKWEFSRLNYLNPKFSHKEIHDLMRNRKYWHCMLTFNQARLTGAWDILKDIAKPIPGLKTNESTMSVRYPNGSLIALVGGEDVDKKRGPGLSGASLDEYSQIPQDFFGTVISKSLGDHLGYCIFSGTIKGHDQLYKTYEAEKHNSDWFSLWQDIDVSLATEEGATITALQQAMKHDWQMVLEGIMAKADYEQEWYLSPEAAIKGSYYGEQITAARLAGRITRVPYEPTLPVDTDWDLGIDAMAVWFSQSTRSGEVRIIDYYEDVGGGLEAAIKAVKGQQHNSNNDPKIEAANMRRGRYIYGKHWGPHDIETTEISSGKTRRQLAWEQGLRFDVTPKLGVDEGITAAQFHFSRCWFDEEQTRQGLLALSHYRRTYNQRLATFGATPVHDGASHGADAFRGQAVRFKVPLQKPTTPKAPPPPRRIATYMGA